MVWILNALDTKSNKSGFGNPFSPAARKGSMNWAHFVGTESHEHPTQLVFINESSGNSPIDQSLN